MVARRALIGLGAAVALATVLILATTRGAEPEGVVEIDVLEATVIDGRLAAAVNIENNDNRQQDVVITLTLGLFGTTDPWDRRVAEIGPRTAGIRSGHTALVVFDSPVAVADGSYELTAWVETEAPSDGVTYTTAGFAVDVADGRIGRMKPVDDGAPHVSTPDISLTGGPILELAGEVAAAAGPEDARLKVDLIPGSDATPWWATTAISTTIFDDATTRGTESVFQVDIQTVPEPGDYRVRLEILDGETVLDAIVLADVVTVEPPPDHIRRDEQPVGPLAILDATPNLEVDDPIVEVVVVNTSDEAVDGVVWWLLAAPREAEPWNFAEARSFEVGRRLEPGEQRTLRLAADGELEAGIGFELSVWAHTSEPGSDETQHSDGVRLNQLIDTTTPSQGE